MADRSYFGFTGKRVPRWLAGTTAAAIVLLGMPALSLAPASATTVGGFEIDGDLTPGNDSPPGEDWGSLSGTNGLQSDTSTAFFREFQTLNDNTVGGQDNTSLNSNNKEEDGTSTKAGAWPLWNATNSTNVAGKSDYGRVGAYAYVDKATGHQFLNIGFDRGSNTGGNATDGFYFELNQKLQGTISVGGVTVSNPNPDRTVGDVRIRIIDQGNGVFSSPQFWKWDGTAWNAITPNTEVYAVADNQSGAVGDLPSWWTSTNVVGGQIPTQGFVEASLDLDSFGAALGCPSTGFAALNARSVTGAGNDYGNLQDYINAMPLFIPSKCANLTIDKTAAVGGAALPGASFTISPNPYPGTPNTGSVTVTDGVKSTVNGVIYGDSDGTADGVIKIAAVKPGIQYTVTESDPPPGYILVTTPQTVTPAEYGGATLTFTDPLGSVAWTKKDHTGGALLGGATFQVKATGGAAAAAPWNLDTNPITVLDNGPKDQDPADGKFSVTGLPTGDYQVTETTAPVGYKIDSTVGTFSISSTTPASVTGKDTTPYVFDDVRNTGALTIEKLDATTHDVVPCPTTPTGCATFDLYQSAGDSNSNFSLYTPANPVIVGLDGTATVTGLPWGHYYFFRETAAPAGYNMPDSTDSVHHLLTAAEADAVTADPTKATVLSVSDSQGAISTVATTKVLLPGNPISDTVTLTGINNAANGTVTFRLYGPRIPLYTPAEATSLGICDSTVAFSASFPVSGVSGNTWTQNSGSFTPTKVGYYYWQVSYTGDTAGNRDLLGVCGDPKEITEVDKAVSHIQTVASDSALQQDGKSHLPAAHLYDSATLTGLTADAIGSVTFTVYGPYAAGLTTCPAGSPLATFEVQLPAHPGSSTVSLNSYTDTTGGTNGYFVPTTVGTYYWKAVYSGDTKNVGSTEACGSANEDTTVLKAVTTTTTESSQVQHDATSQKLPGVTVGDTATVTGLNTGVAAGGTVTFALYPSSNGVCAANPVYTSDPVNLTDNGDGTGTASVSGVPVLNAGTYYWTATYSGDANNLGSHDSCGEESEKIVVDKASPTIATTAAAVGNDTTLPGVSVTDTATVSGLAVSPNETDLGTVTFRLYGPFTSDTPASDTCSVALYTSPQPVPLALVNGKWQASVSPSVDLTQAGRYRWVASYSGDEDNNTAVGSCIDPNELVTVAKASPSITTQATDGAAPLGVDPASTTTVSDSATVSGLTADATGTVTFTLYGPVSDANAANPCLNGEPPLNNVYGTSVTVPLGTVSGGSATASSGPVTVSLPADQNLGYFFWVASYSGDGNNRSVTGVCPDPNEMSTVTRSGVPHLDKSSPTENTTVLPGATIHYVVTLSNTGGLPLTDNLVDTLPVGVTPVDGTYTKDGSAFAPTSVVGRVITWSDVTVDAGQTVVFAYDVTVNADVVAGTLTNTATWAGQSDHTVHTLLPGVPGLDKSSPTEQGSVANPTGDVNPGGTIHYSIRLSNTGGTAITSDLVDTLPAGVTPVTGTFSPSAPTINGATLTWSKVTVAAKSSIEFIFDATVNATTGAGPLVNTATWAEKTDKTTHNVVLVPVVTPNPTLTKTADPTSGSTVAQGQVITYTVKVGNTGNGPEVGDLVDTLPVGVVPVDGSYTKDGVASAPDSVTATTITWKNVTVSPGQTITFTYRVTVTSATGGAQLVNTATYLGLVKTTTHTLGTIPTTGGELPKTGAPFDPITVALWASLLLALGVMFLVFGRRNDEYEG